MWHKRRSHNFMLHDIRVAWRFLRKAPVSTTIAVITLGVTVAIRSLAAGILDETLSRPLAVDSIAGSPRSTTIARQRRIQVSFCTLITPTFAIVCTRVSQSRRSCVCFKR